MSTPNTVFTNNPAIKKVTDFVVRCDKYYFEIYGEYETKHRGMKSFNYVFRRKEFLMLLNNLDSRYSLLCDPLGDRSCIEEQIDGLSDPNTVYIQSYVNFSFALDKERLQIEALKVMFE